MRKTVETTCSGSKKPWQLQNESDFSLKEWAFKAKLSHHNRSSRRFSESNLKSFRENASTFRSDFTVSSTASPPGCTLNGEIDPSTYSFTTALKALQAKTVYTWEYMSPYGLGLALSSKWNDAERYICNPLSGQFPLECLSAKTLSGRSFPGKKSRITMSAPLVCSSSSMNFVPHANSLIPEHESEIEMTSQVKRSKHTRDVGIQSTPADDSRSLAQTLSNGERSMKICHSSSLCSQKLKPETEVPMKEMVKVNAKQCTQRNRNGEEERKKNIVRPMSHLQGCLSLKGLWIRTIIMFKDKHKQCKN